MAMLLGSSMLVSRPGAFMAAMKLPGATKSKRKSYVVSASIGFSTDPQIQVEKAAGALLKDVAALLVYQEVFRSPPAQAFLKLLLVLRRRDDELKIFEAHGEFLRLMASGHHPSWEDFLLEGILKAEGNAFAEAAAGVGVSTSSYGGEVPASLEAAAAADLACLQRLSVNESTLTNWITELVSETKPEWRAAASSNLSCKSVPKITSSSNQKPRLMGFNLSDATEPDAVEPPTEKLEGSNEKRVVRRETDVVVTEREEWQRKIGGLWKWCEAVPLLKEYYSKHGFGVSAMSQVVKWRAGKLMADFKYLKAAPAGPDLIALENQRVQLINCLESFIISRRFPSRHIFLQGPRGSGKSWLLRAVLHRLSEKSRFRLVILPSSDIKQLPTILESLQKSITLSFVIIIEDLFLRAADESFLLLKTLLDEHMQEWPENVFLCVTSTRDEAKLGDSSVKLGHIFGQTIKLPELNEDEYLQCFRQILDHHNTELKDSLGFTKQAKEQALERGRQTGFSVQTAARFADTILKAQQSKVLSD